MSEYEWPGELLVAQVFTAGVVLAFSNAKIYEVNFVSFRRGKLIALEVLLMCGLYCFSCGTERKGSWEHSKPFNTQRGFIRKKGPVSIG